MVAFVLNLRNRLFFTIRFNADYFLQSDLMPIVLFTFGLDSRLFKHIYKLSNSYCETRPQIKLTDGEIIRVRTHIKYNK